MRSAFRLAAAAVLVAASGPLTLHAQPGACPLEVDGRGVVAAVPDGETVALADGTVIRLINALPPRSPPAGRGGAAALAETARRWLEDAVLGRAVRFAHGGRQQDRRGRRLAHLFLDEAEGIWLQGAMVERGLARAYSFADNRACVAALLAREATARAARRGFWSDPAWEVLPAEPPDRALAELGRFAIVEGTVLSVGERRLRTYLNFGTYWNVDFTVMAAGRDRDRIAAAGIDLASLAGQMVRVRGWILDERGPAMMVTHPEQIEIVDNR